MHVLFVFFFSLLLFFFFIFGCKFSVSSTLCVVFDLQYTFTMCSFSMLHVVQLRLHVLFQSHVFPLFIFVVVLCLHIFRCFSFFLHIFSFFFSVDIIDEFDMN